MDPISETHIENTNLKEVVFAKTPIMSTYLLAFVVHIYVHILVAYRYACMRLHM